MPDDVVWPVSRQALGQLGENAAARYLTRQGYTLIARNWRYGRLGEIDIIAHPPGAALLAFIEVKTRRSRDAGAPFEAITPKKQQTLIHLIQAFLAEHPQYATCDCRADAIGAQVLMPERRIRITHLQNVLAE